MANIFRYSIGRKTTERTTPISRLWAGLFGRKGVTKLIANEFFTGLAQLLPTIVLNTPADSASVSDTTPTLNFTGTDLNGDVLEYEVQIDTVNTFDSVAGTPVINDSYSETNQDAIHTLGLNYDDGASQTFTASINGILDSTKFSIQPSGSPTGNALMKIYAVTGTMGVDSKPTGTALAVSDNFNVATLGAGFTQPTFTFSGANRINIVAGTNYAVTFEYKGGDVSNFIYTAVDTTSATHIGNDAVLAGGVWYDEISYDAPFYVYTIGPSTPLLDKVSNVDIGFTAGHPFSSGVAIDYTVQSALSLLTYYWRVRVKDPLGTNTFGSWSEIRSFTISTSSIKTINGLAIVSVKTVNGLAIVSVKSINGLN